jgi:hypothetical protein
MSWYYDFLENSQLVKSSAANPKIMNLPYSEVRLLSSHLTSLWNANLQNEVETLAAADNLKVLPACMPCCWYGDQERYIKAGCLYYDNIIVWDSVNNDLRYLSEQQGNISQRELEHFSNSIKDLLKVQPLVEAGIVKILPLSESIIEEGPKLAFDFSYNPEIQNWFKKRYDWWPEVVKQYRESPIFIEHKGLIKDPDEFALRMVIYDIICPIFIGLLPSYILRSNMQINPLRRDLIFAEDLPKNAFGDYENIVPRRLSATLDIALEFAPNANFEQILELREKEGLAFTKFRRRLVDLCTRTIDNNLTQDASDDDIRRHLKMYISDEFDELTEIFKRINSNAKRNYSKKVLGEILSPAILSISCFISGNPLSMPLSALLASFAVKGLVGVWDDYTKFQESMWSEIRKNDFYFLWSLSH